MDWRRAPGPDEFICGRHWGNCRGCIFMWRRVCIFQCLRQVSHLTHTMSLHYAYKHTPDESSGLLHYQCATTPWWEITGSGGHRKRLWHFQPASLSSEVSCEVSASLWLLIWGFKSTDTSPFEQRRPSSRPSITMLDVVARRSAVQHWGLCAHLNATACLTGLISGRSVSCCLHYCGMSLFMLTPCLCFCVHLPLLWFLDTKSS